MSNPKKIDLAAYLQDDDAPMNSPFCLGLECDNFAQPDDEFCAEHAGKQAVKQAGFPARKNGRITGVSPWRKESDG